MKKLVVLSGPPGSGKSTFIKKHNLDAYTLCPDTLRLMFDAPQMNEDGYEISQKYNRAVFELLHNLLEARMKKGAFTVVDATHTAEKDFNKYKALCKTYRYKMIIVPFRASMETLMERNKTRGMKKVPEEVIIRMKTKFDAVSYNFGTVVEPENFADYIQYYPVDLSEYKKINHIGDIHGCYTVLQNILPLKDDEFYIFLGDYFDRGAENAEVAKWILENYKRSNVVFLKGNHEIHLDDYVNGNDIKSSEFEKTVTDFENAKIKLSDLRHFSDALQYVFLYTYKEKTVLCSHGGVGFYPENINLVDPMQFVRGVGNYSTEIDKIFTAPKDTYQVHGHRNILRLPITAGPQSFNLTDEVEFGGYLRVLSLDDIGFNHNKFKNTVFKQKDNTEDQMIFNALSTDKDIHVKNFGHISSLNFSRNVFYNKTWNERTIMARGLFVNNTTFNVVCRGYEKFFNINEVPSTTEESLKDLQFPVSSYVKENGYLGLLGIDESTESLVFASKSTIEGDYALNFEKIMKEKFSAETLNKLKFEMMSRNICLVFEVIDPIFDPHIIEYKEKDVILLDIISREYTFKKQTFGQTASFAKRYGMNVKKKAKTFNNYESMINYIKCVQNSSFKYDGEFIEGFVFEDSNGFQFKVKSGYYNFWKALRKVIFDKGNTSKALTYLAEEDAAKFNEILSTVEVKEGDSIISVRNRYESR